MNISRRELVGAALATAASAAIVPGVLAATRRPLSLRSPYKQGLTRMALGPDTSVEDCSKIAASLGCKGLDFFSDPSDWPILRRHGLICSMYRSEYGGKPMRGGRTPPGPPGWHSIGMKEAQGEYRAAIDRAIDLAADNGLPNVLVLCGTRQSVSHEEGAANAVAFCNLIKDHAERRGVTLCMELINSTGVGGPPLSLFDHAAWGFDVCRRVASPRVKVLYDIFHAQIMDGNIADTIRKNIALIGHFHVGGVPGRHELDDSQELNYRFLGRTIAATGYTGFITHEYVPSPGGDPIAKLRRSVEIMDG